MISRKNNSILTKLVVTSLCLLFVASCNDKEDILSNSPAQRVFSAISEDLDSVDNLCCVFEIYSQTDWSKIGEQVVALKSNHCWAYITDGWNFMNPKSMICNGFLMHDMAEDGTAGQFEYSIINSYLPSVSWEMRDYFNADYIYTDANLPEIMLTNISYGDTLDKAEGISINYTGSTGNGLITAALYVDKTYRDGHRERFLVEREVPDNGQIMLTSLDLMTLPITVGTEIRNELIKSKDILTIELSRHIVNTELFNNRTFIKLFKSDFTIECDLK